MNTPDTEGSVEELMRDLRHLASPYAETLSDMQRTSQFILLVNRLDKAMRTPDTSSCTSCNGWGANGGASCNTCTKNTPDTGMPHPFANPEGVYPTSNTPDTEFDSDKEVVGSDCLCVLGSKKHNPECEYATPDTEWEKVVEEFYLNFTDIEKQELDTPSWNHNGVTPYLVEQWIRTLRTRHDTYWKERVQSLTDYIEHDNQCIISQAHRGRPTNDGGYETQYGDKWYRSPDKPECDCGLDTLLGNLK